MSEPLRNSNAFITKFLFAVLLFICLAFILYFFSSGNIVGGLPFAAIPFVAIYLYIIFINPIVGFASAFVANYFVMGIARYLPGPLGLAVDGLLVLTWLSVVFSQFNKNVDWKNAANGLTFLSVVWFAYALLQLFNPEARSREAWFYAMRGVSFYMFLTIPLVFILFNHPKYLNKMIKLLAWFTLLAVAKGMMQKYIGPDPWEQRWLNVIGGKTHLLPGGLRVFSFFTDSATYGGSMGFAGVVYIIIASYTKEKRLKIFYAITGFAAIYAMFISGTRGALAVPLAGFAFFAVLSKQIKTLIISGAVMMLFVGLLKFTTVGNSVYEIRRFRGGLDQNNDSFQVRVENRKKFAAYLASRPFGGGIGSAGNWGLRFSPGTFLAETPPDGWYIQIWAEQGIVGLYLHIFILIYIVGTSSFISMFRLQNTDLKGKANGLISGLVGVIAASYSSSALGQMPNGIIIYTSIAFVYMMPHWEKKYLNTSDTD